MSTPLASPPVPSPDAERDAALSASCDSGHVASLLRLAGHLLDEFTPPISPQARAVIEEISAVIAAAELFNGRVQEFIDARA